MQRGKYQDNHQRQGRSMADRGNEDYQGRENNEKNLEGWRKYHDNMVHKMADDRMRDALRKKDKGMLERAIQDCEHNNLREREGDMKRAEGALRVIKAKEQLREAVKSGNPDSVRSEIEAIETAPNVRKHLQNEVREARYAAERQERLHRLHTSILDMDKKTMTEMRRYHKPPPRVHRVMQAALLILGEDEEATSEWRECQKLMNPQGAQGLNRRVMEFKMEELHPEIAARSKAILEEEDMSLEQVQSVSSGAGTFWVWNMGLVEEVERYHKANGTTGKGAPSAQPANIHRQKEIFGRLPVHSQHSPRRARKPGHLRSSHDEVGHSYTGPGHSNTLSPRDQYPDKRYVSPARNSNPHWS